MRRSWLVGIVLGVLAWCAPAASARTPLPVIYNGAYGYAHASPSLSPPGANDFTCQPSAAHPRPVILVHGTFEDMSDNWQAVSPLLYNHGYCVFALNYGSYKGSRAYGVYGTGPIEKSAMEELGPFIDKVLAATHASQVDLVGHSQGGMMPRWYLHSSSTAASKVHALIGLSPSNHGTTLDGLFTLASYFPGSNVTMADCPACQEQEAGSPFMVALNSKPDPSNVSYTVIQSTNDEVVTPYASAFLPQATDITLQTQCVLDQGEHLSMPYDHIADRDVLNALDPSHAVPPACSAVAPFVGG